jgi:8-oxo-dGTP diphosphatase
MMKKATLCYIRKRIEDGAADNAASSYEYLMLYRNKKKEDPNEGKWIGVGGKFEPGETPDECMLREVKEETGLVPDSYHFCGVIHFFSDEWEDEDMYLYSSDDFVPDDPAAAEFFSETGEYKPPFCSEGELAWIPKDQILNLNMWEGDRAFVGRLLEGQKEISLTLQYTGEHCTITSG